MKCYHIDGLGRLQLKRIYNTKYFFCPICGERIEGEQVEKLINKMGNDLGLDPKIMVTANTGSINESYLKKIMTDVHFPIGEVLSVHNDKK